MQVGVSLRTLTAFHDKKSGSVPMSFMSLPCHWQVVTELKNRGVQDIFIACVDGLKGFPEAIEAVYPHAAVLWCATA